MYVASTAAIRTGWNGLCSAIESVGLVGANGIGKSMILKLLTGLLDHEGSIRMFDMEVNREHLGEIRRRMWYVFQDSDNQLFMPTVYDDLAFAPRRVRSF